MPEIVSARSNEQIAGKYLTFAVSSERYGIAILRVQEIIGVPSITKVPRCPDYIKGVVNLRGRIIPLVDLRLKFELEPKTYDEKTCIIVVNIQRDNQPVTVGVIVDTVLEVIDFSPEEIENAPDYGMQIDSAFLLGMGKRNESLNILIDIEKVLSGADKEKLAEIKQ